MKDIILLHYNNYFNRQVKKAGDLEGDYTSLDTYYTAIRTVNFNPSDGVDTSLILGKGEQPTPSNDYDTYDYLIVTDPNDNDHPVLSRWFIIDRNRTRDGQFDFTLKRDVIVDNLERVKDATTFIEKGIISDTTNPLLYNSESMTYNQIKQEETLLKDSTGCGWVVGYIPQDAFQTITTVSKDVVLQSSADITVNDISTWTYYNASSLSSSQEIWSTSSLSKQLQLKTKLHYPAYSRPSAGINWQEQRVKGTIYVPQGGTVTSSVSSSSTSYDSWSGVVVNHSNGIPNPPSSFNEANYLANNMPSDSTLWSNLDSVLRDMGFYGNLTIKTQSQVNGLIALDGKTIKDTASGSIYKIHLRNVSASGGTLLDNTYASVNTFMNRLNSDIVRSSSGGTGSNQTVGNYNIADVQVGYNGNGYTLEITQIFTFAGVEIDNNRNHLVDAPYDMFCIPYSDTKSIKVGTGSGNTVICSKELAISLAQEISKDAGSGSIYDTQLLPYCPSQELVTKNPNIYNDDATIDVTGLSFDVIRDITNSFVQVSVNAVTWNNVVAQHGQLYDEQYRPINYYAASNNTYYYRTANTGNVLGALVWCTSATRSFDINTPISVSSDALERKVESECDFYRLCSGNYQGVFEFNASKSFGVSGFRVDCTFKPFNPYIHIVPKLGGLYGNDFADYRDARGLICGGDFSLAQMSNAWANYELQNKNYQNIFDRQIQNMDVMNSIAKQEAAIQIATGSVTGATSGAVSGALIGGPVGGVIGGVVGGATGIAGGIADYSNLVKRQEEIKSFATDMYGYQLGNIKAIPTSLSKNTALTANTKIFPFIEKYSCTDIEKQALRNKLTYNGMTIMNIGEITPYVGTGFIKGQIIRFNGLQEDSHMANAIYSEINKGVYI